MKDARKVDWAYVEETFDGIGYKLYLRGTWKTDFKSAYPLSEDAQQWELKIQYGDTDWQVLYKGESWEEVVDIMDTYVRVTEPSQE